MHSKNVIPNIIAPEIWPYREIAERCELLIDGQWQDAQHTACATLLSPHALD